MNSKAIIIDKNKKRTKKQSNSNYKSKLLKEDMKNENNLKIKMNLKNKKKRYNCNFINFSQIKKNQKVD